MRYQLIPPLCLLFLLFSSTVKAQIYEPDKSLHHLFGITAGFDHNLVALNLNYTYYLPQYKTGAFVSITQGTALLGTGNLQLQIGLQSWQGSFRKFNLKSRLSFMYVRSDNNAGTYNSLGLNLVLNPGLSLGRFGAGLDLQLNPLLATNIQHSDYFRTYVYSDVKDGWYNTSAINLRIGIYLTYLFLKHKTLEVFLKGGYQTNGVYDQLIPGIYFNLGLNYRLK